jgi:predicted Zn-dependent peptidase
LLFQSLFPGHPNGLPPHGREDALTKLTRDALSQWHARTVKRQFPLVVITGDTEGSALVSGNIADGFRRREVDQKLSVKVAHPPEPGEKAEQRRRLTTSLTVGFAGPKGNSAEVAVLELIEATMNGPGGRLAVELGRKQGVAYDARLAHEAMLTAGVILAQLVTSPAQEQRARAGLLAELERLVREGLKPDELEGARAAAAVTRAALWRSQPEHALTYARAVFADQPATGVDAVSDRWAKISAEEVKRAAAQYFKPASAAAGIVRGSQPPAPQSPPRQN